MNDAVNLEKLLISNPYGSKNEFESVATFEESDPYIRWLSIDFALENEAGSSSVFIYGEAEKADDAARLFGALILGEQALRDGEDLKDICDACNCDLYEAIEELDCEGLLESPDVLECNILYIHSLELSSTLMDASNLHRFFDRIPWYVFQYTNVMPQIVYYQIASVEGYYEEAASKTSYDRRSVDETSPQLFANNGYTSSESGILLYKIVDNGTLLPCDNADNSSFIEDNRSADNGASLDDSLLLTKENQELRSLPETSAKQLEQDSNDDLDKTFVFSKRSLLENHIGLSVGANMALVPRTAPKKLTQYVEAAIFAHDLGVRMDYALEKYVSDSEVDIPPIYALFQKMYFTGKNHIDATIERMKPIGAPSAGETFADVALVRAANTYYVAALLYREGHTIEAHAMSRLMLEQIAWAFAACEVDECGLAEAIVPTKAISKLKKKIKSVGKMYGVLSKYVHIPIQGHYEFIDLSHGRNEVLTQFGVHSYARGAIISQLADFWSAVYEYTQSRHFEKLENWIETPSGLEMNPERPFLSVIQPICEELMREYEENYPSYDEYIKSHWKVDDISDNEPNDAADEPFGGNK